jgi:uncharacterized membrane protein
MSFFQNMIIAAVLTGTWTRISNWLLKKKVGPATAVYLSFWIGLIVFAPTISWIAGFDVLVAEYVIALIMWLLIDLIWIKIQEQKR